MPIERSVVLLKMKAAQVAGQSASAFIKTMRDVGLSYRRQTMLSDWRNVGNIAKKEGDNFVSNAFVLTRHGDKGDQAATYDLTVCGDSDLTNELFAFKQSEFDPKDVADALKGAKEIIEA